MGASIIPEIGRVSKRLAAKGDRFNFVGARRNRQNRRQGFLECGASAPLSKAVPRHRLAFGLPLF